MPVAKKKRATSTDKHGGISSAAVEKATGRSWTQWLSVLDKARCKTKDHKTIVAAVKKTDSSVSGWWQQMVTVGYEQARGLRIKHEKPGGFEVGASKTINVPVAKAYRAWSDARMRNKWLDEKVAIRTSTKDKSMRLDSADGVTILSVNFYKKDAGKCQVALQHTKLKNAKQADKVKAQWKDRLSALKDYLER